MIIPNPKGEKPKIDPDCFIAPNATIIGNVTIKKGANIWYGAVIRGDQCEIIIGENTSIQDNCVVHSEPGTRLEIKDHCVIGHMAMVHGPGAIGSHVLIGIGSKILQGCNIGDGSMIGAGAVVLRDIPEDSLAVGIPATVKKRLNGEGWKRTEENAMEYVENAKMFLEANLKEL